MEYQSLNGLLAGSFKKNWDRPALSNYQGTTLNYKDVALKIAQLHLAFRECGLREGDRVALCSRNQANWGVCFLAALTYGAVPVPILHEFKPENIHFLVGHSESKIFFVEDSIWDGLSEREMQGVSIIVSMNSQECLYAADAPVRETWEKLQERFDARYPEGFGPSDIVYHEDRPEELAMINYTSGTSGFSKGVMIPYRALKLNVHFATFVAEPQMDSNSQVVAMLPSAHMYGLMFEFLFEMSIGAHVHFLTKAPSPKIILNAFADIHPAVIIAVPLIIEKVYKSNVKPVADRSKPFIYFPLVGRIMGNKIRKALVEAFGAGFEEVIIGGAAFNPEVEDFLRAVRFPFTVGYGMTECSPIITYARWNRTKKGSCGKPVPGCEIRIDSPDPQRTPGEIQVRGDNVFLGYLKNPKATEEVFTEDGWFRTGDMGIVDRDGYLYLKGRSKCMILGPSGQNIYPEELEAVINNAPYVVDSLVVEEDGGLTALVYPDYALAEQKGMSADDLHDFLVKSFPDINKSLPSYAQIRKMEMMPEDFERTPKKSIKRYLYQKNQGF